jgi:hypothetical protein
MFYPDEALQRLEEVSYLVKNKDNKNIEEFLRIQDKRLYAAPNAAVSKATGKSVDSVLKMVYVSQNYYLTVIDFKFRKSQCPSMTINQEKRVKKKLKKQENLLALCPISVKITNISTHMQVLVSVNMAHISCISLWKLFVSKLVHLTSVSGVKSEELMPITISLKLQQMLEVKAKVMLRTRVPEMLRDQDRELTHLHTSLLTLLSLVIGLNFLTWALMI